MRYPKPSWRPNDWTLRNRLILGITLLAFLGFFLFGFAAQSAYKTFLIEQVDTQLTSIVDATLVRIDRAGIQGETSDEDQPFKPLEPIRGVPSAVSITLIDENKNIIGTVGGDFNSIKIEMALDRIINGVTSETPFTLKVKNTNYRIYALVLPSGLGTVVATVSLDDVESNIEQLRFLFSLIGVIVLILIGSLSRRAIRISLKPLRDVEITAGAIAEGDLSARLPDAKPHTEVGNLVASLNQMLSRIEESFDVRIASENKLRRFVADASHELRTPLTAIRGFAELYRQGAVLGEEKTAELVKRIENESVRMGALVEDLLLLARLDQAPEIEKIPVDLSELLGKVVESARVSGPEYPIELDIPDEEIFILADEHRIFQIVANLLENVRSHTLPGTRIKVQLTQNEVLTQVRISDNGPGIGAEDLLKIFERFYRADTSRIRLSKNEGTGLGLSIVKALMIAHGGDVEVQSKLGEGSTFTLTFPIDDFED
jgi:two-component system OmpR family sensor kinase